MPTTHVTHPALDAQVLQYQWPQWQSCPSYQPASAWHIAPPATRAAMVWSWRDAHASSWSIVASLVSELIVHSTKSNVKNEPLNCTMGLCLNIHHAKRNVQYMLSGAATWSDPAIQPRAKSAYSLCCGKILCVMVVFMCQLNICQNIQPAHFSESWDKSC